jgi:Lrp/AsnC family leucine-responsive transcriptional regulator
MPYTLTDSDIIIIKQLLKDGWKSFRQNSRETGISAPTVKAKFDRFVHIGFIKSVLPIFNFKKVVYPNNREIYSIKSEHPIKGKQNINNKFGEGMAIRVKCNYCSGPIYGKTHILKFADFERFFCCIGCKSSFKKKYHGRIEAIKRKRRRQPTLLRYDVSTSHS